MSEASWPLGFRFDPTDKELIAYYLQKKINTHKIAEVDLYKSEPWGLPAADYLWNKGKEHPEKISPSKELSTFGETSLHVAARAGNVKIVKRLVEMIGDTAKEMDHIDSLLAVIDLGLYDIANEMVSENPGLAIQVNSKGETALYAIAGNVSKTTNGRIKLIKELLKRANKGADFIKGPLFRAAREGNSEFISRALHLYPELAIQLDDNNHTIFHVAVQHRHVDVVNMMQEIDYSVGSFVKSMTDREGNNILHLAAKLPVSGLEVVLGPALQLQRELLWFKEVEKLVGLQHMRTKNESCCVLLFEKEHEELRRKGEKWLTKTANSCMLVAALITTVTFAAAFSPRNGNQKHTEFPLFLNEFWYKTFATSIAITLIFSASSVLFFLSILTSTYSMSDFLISLPFKLLLGLFSLSTSILAMMIACFAAFFGIFKQHLLLQLPYYTVSVVAFIPVAFVARLYLPLLYCISRSMLMSVQFRRNRFFC